MALEKFSTKLTRSGYSRVQSKIILESSIRGFKNKLARSQVHRPISEIQFNRELKKILEKPT